MDEIGHYRVIQKVGSGGMGSVYLATDTRLDRKVAIKVLNPELLNNSLARLRFEREAKLIASLAHPNITILYEIGEHDGKPFLVMEYVEGKSLAELTALGPIPITEFMKYSVEITEALDHAHRRGVVHRDIKASNVMVAADGRIKLLDFGLAQFSGANSINSQATRLTDPGSWVGTMHYAAPEVLAGRVADHLSDIYSLGVLLYEMASGRLPFFNLSGYALVTAILHGQVAPLSQFNPTFPAAIVDCIERAMALAPADRFATASALAEALRTASADGAKGGSPARSSTASITILEFTNLSHDAALDWLGVGITETLTSDLTRLDQLRVVPADQLKLKPSGGNTDPIKIAREAGVTWVFTGSYQRSGDRVRITPRLLEAATGNSVFSGKIDGRWDDIFELQDRVVKELIDALQLKIGSSSMQRILAPETAHLEAYEHFAQGRKSFVQLGKTSLEDARQHFERALELDPHYAVAHSALGSTYAMRFIHRTDPSDLARAAAHLEKALELDSELAEPHVYLAYVYARQGNLDAAVREGYLAVGRQPDFGKAHYFLAAALVGQGEIDLKYQQDAVSELLKCLETDSRWTAALTILATLAIVGGEPDQALDYLELQAKTELESAVPKFPGTEMLRGTALLQRGNYDAALGSYGESIKILEGLDFMYRDAFLALSHGGLGEAHLRVGHPDLALPEFRRAYQTIQESRILGGERVLTRTIAGMASAYAATGDVSKAKGLAENASERLQAVLAEPHTWIWETLAAQLCYRVAEAHLSVGDQNGALQLLHLAVSKGWRDSTCLAHDPMFSILHQNAEFQAAVRAARNLPRLNFCSKNDKIGMMSAN